MIQGVKLRRNAKNKFVVFELRYDADPSKRDSSWKDAAKSGMPIAQWNQEYEINWDSFAGMPVYQDFSAQRHVTQVKPEPWIGLPLLRGWDFGLTPACVIAQMQDQTLVVFEEYTAFNKGAEQFCELILPQIHTKYRGVEWMDFADPAGVAKAQSDERTCFEVLGSFGITPIPGPVAFEARRKAVDSLLVRRTRQGESVRIYEPRCPILVRGFNGGYRYPEKAKDVEPEKLRPIKDVHSHPHDAFQYRRRDSIRWPTLTSCRHSSTVLLPRSFKMSQSNIQANGDAEDMPIEGVKYEEGDGRQEVIQILTGYRNEAREAGALYENRAALKRVKRVAGA